MVNLENFSQGPPSDAFRKGNWEYLKIGEKKIENCKIVNSTPGQKEAIQIVQNITLKNENRQPERTYIETKFINVGMLKIVKCAEFGILRSTIKKMKKGKSGKIKRDQVALCRCEQ